jgi:hypothetical protein
METSRFNDVLEAADRLSPDDQETLIDILHRRLLERRRNELNSDINRGLQEFQNGACRTATAAEIMKEIRS